MNPSQATLEWMRGRANFTQETVTALGNRISTWLIIGNAAAAIFVMKAAVDGSPCDPAILRTALGWFVSGLGVAFFGLVLVYISSLAASYLIMETVNKLSTVVQNQYYIDNIEEEFSVELEEDSPMWKQIHEVNDELPRLQAKVRWLWWPTGAAMLLMGASAVCLGMGAVQPVVAATAISCFTG